MRFIGAVALSAMFAVPIQCPAGLVPVLAGFNLIANPGTSGYIYAVLPVVNDGDTVYFWNGSSFDIDYYYDCNCDDGMQGWIDALTGNPGTIYWEFGTSMWYFCANPSENLSFTGDPPQPVPTPHAGYNYLGNVTSNVLGYSDIALGQFDPAVCPAYLYNQTTGNLDAYYYGVCTPLSVNPSEGVIFVQPPVLSINPTTTNSSVLQITWEGGGQLQTTASLSSGSWTAVTNATSPFLVTNNLTTSLFLRVSLPPPTLP